MSTGREMQLSYLMTFGLSMSRTRGCLPFISIHDSVFQITILRGHSDLGWTMNIQITVYKGVFIHRDNFRIFDTVTVLLEVQLLPDWSSEFY